MRTSNDHPLLSKKHSGSQESEKRAPEAYSPGKGKNQPEQATKLRDQLRKE